METLVDFSKFQVEDIVKLIDDALSGDNAKIRDATKILKMYTKSKESIRLLTFILVNSQQISHRQMVTILLKRNIANLYNGLTPVEQQEFRSLLLSQYVKESQIIIQKGISTLVGLLLPIVEIKNWIQLQQLLDQAVQSAPDSAATFVLLNNLLYHFKPPKELYAYIFNALRADKLLDEAMKCLLAVAETQDVDASFATQLISIWSQSQWPEEVSIAALEVLNVLCERRIRLGEEITIWVCDHIIANQKLSNKFRTAGCDYLFALTDFNAKWLGTHQQVLRKVISTVCLTCSEPYHHDEDRQEAGEFVQEVALWLIQTLAITVKAKRIYPVLFEAVCALINSDNDFNKINTGYLVLGAMSEGCVERLKRNLANPIMNVLIPKGLNHPAPEVRGAAINALCCFSEHLLPNIFEFHSVFIPSMVKAIDDHSQKVVSKAIIAIDVFFDGMEEEEILLYLPSVIPKLQEALLNQHSTPLIRAASLSGIGSAITAAGLQFEPYVENVLKICDSILKMPVSPQTTGIRAENLNVLGKLANVFCKPEYGNCKAFYQTYIMPAMEHVYSMLLKESDPQIRQASFGFFYLIANAIGSAFEPVFDNIIHHIVQACQIKEPPKNQKAEYSLDSDSEDENKQAHMKISEFDEKAAGIHALGQLAKACPMKFLPFFQQAYRILEEHYQFFYENVRIQVCICYTNLTIGLVKSQFGGQLPPFKKGLPCADRLSNEVEEHFRTELIPRLIFLMTEDEDSRVKGAAIESLEDLVKELGPVVVDKSMETIREAIKNLLDDPAEDEEDEEEEQEEDDTEINTFESVTELIPTLAANLGYGFEPVIRELHPFLMKYLQEREDVNDNIQMAGCLSQCFKLTPGYVESHHEELFKALGALIPLWDTQLNRNIAYCFAEMFEKSSSAMVVHLQDGLLLLKQIFDHVSSLRPCKDNALGAICRIIYTINPPLPHAVFLESLLSLMPFSGDEEEERTAWKMIIFLAKTNPMVLKPFVGRIGPIVEHDLSSPKKYNIDEQLAGELSQLLVFLRS